MERFHVLDDAAVILRSKGVFRQAKVFVRGAGLYAGVGTGFTRLYEGGNTGVPTVSWDDIDLGLDRRSPISDGTGRLVLGPPVKQIKGGAE